MIEYFINIGFGLFGFRLWFNINKFIRKRLVSSFAYVPFLLLVL